MTLCNQEAVRFKSYRCPQLPGIKGGKRFPISTGDDFDLSVESKIQNAQLSRSLYTVAPHPIPKGKIRRNVQQHQ